MNKMMRVYISFFFLLFRTGCLFGIGFGLYSAYQEFRVEQGGVAVQAELKEPGAVREQTDRQGNVTSYEVKLFYSLGGREYSTRMRVNENMLSELRSGEPLSLKVLPNAPEKVSANPWAAIVFSIFFSFVAGLLLLFSFWFGRRMKQKTRPEIAPTISKS
jgi:hypothetical protein